MADINVTAHGINPETGEYLSPAERKALFKKQRMGSKINPDSFRSGTFSSTKKSGGGGGALVKFNVKDVVSAGAIVKSTDAPKQDPVQGVKVEDLGSVENKKSNNQFKTLLEKLLETFRNILKKKSDQTKVETRADRLLAGSVAKKKTKSKKKPRRGKDIFGIGRKIKGSVTKAFGNIFSIFGDILAFAALNWISDPKNKETVKTVVKIVGKIFQWVDGFVTFTINTALTGFSELVTPGNSLGERFGGFLKIFGLIIGLRWLTNPFKIFKDLKGGFKFFKGFGKFVNRILKKPIAAIEKFVFKFIGGGLKKLFKSSLLKPIRTFITKIGGKVGTGLLKSFGRGIVKFISKIPVVGALLDFALNVFVFKENPGRAAFKAIGAALLGLIGTALGPIGTIIGGIAGDWAGGALYDFMIGGKVAKMPPLGVKDDKKPEESSGGSDTDKTRQSSPSTANITPLQQQALDVLAKYESGPHGYEAVNQIGTNEGRGVAGFSGSFTNMKQHGGKSLTSLTIGDIKKLQYDDRSMTNQQWIDAGKLHAVGKYQFIGNTLPGVAQRAGIPDSAKFSPKVQDLMALQLMKERGISPWVGPSDKATAGERQIIERARKQPISYGAGPMITPPPVTRKAQPAMMSTRMPSTAVMPDQSRDITISKKMKRVASAPIIINNTNFNTRVNSASVISLNSKNNEEQTVLSKL